MEQSTLAGDSKIREVYARWDPKEECRPIINDAPIFFPTVEEFNDTIGYIMKIRPQAEPYGICRIVPPSSWVPPCPLRENNVWKRSKFSTRVQLVDLLQNREPIMRKKRKGRKRKRRHSRTYTSTNSSFTNCEGLEEANVAPNVDEKFGFKSGSDYTFEDFQKCADNFKKNYFGIDEKWEPSIENIEGEYWRIIEQPTDEVEVYYGADLETGVFISGFPKVSSPVSESDSDRYIKSGWNLNNLSRQPGSVLSFEESDISGVLVPWLYVGMCFSSFCWHVEDHHLYSLNYLHWGDPKLWYGVPGIHATALENAMRKHLPDLFEENPDLLHELVTQLSPSVLKCEGVPVYRVVQHSGEFVLTFPRAYHSGFNCGFNCAEAVNVAPADWLSHGQTAVELYSKQCRKTSLSHDKLLFGSANESVCSLYKLAVSVNEDPRNFNWKSVCGKDGILTNAVEARFRMEEKRINSLKSRFRIEKMQKDFDAVMERECFSCFYDLHLAAATCKCCPERFACLKHADAMCSCKPANKSIILRHSMNELATLVEALSGRLDCLKVWASEKLELECLTNEGSSSCCNLVRDNEKEGENICSTSIREFLVESNGHKMEQKGYIDLNLKLTSKETDIKQLGSDWDATLSSSRLRDSANPCTSCNINDDNNNNSNSNNNNYYNNSNSNDNKLFGFELSIPRPVPRPYSDVNSTISLASDTLYSLDDMIVVALNFGSLVVGRRWCNKLAIFPKGFRSRVKFFNVFNPKAICNYVSEVLDGGPLGPFFKVSLEDWPNKSFINVSPEKCWEMVRKRLNEEISVRKSQGEQVLPPLHPSNSINGLQMFGFLSPPIIQGIEDLDPKMQCGEYWEHKLTQSSMSATKNLGLDGVKKDEEDVECVVQGLFEKASFDELRVMHRILATDSWNGEWKSALAVLVREIDRRG